MLLFLVGLYRSIGTSFLGGSCRFHPSCSAYALEALHKYPPQRACRLILYRIFRCRPGGGFGFDPVPQDEGKVLR